MMFTLLTFVPKLLVYVTNNEDPEHFIPLPEAQEEFLKAYILRINQRDGTDLG